MILTEKNKGDVKRPTRKLFGEDWFVSPEMFDHEFYGVEINESRPQPFPTLQAAQNFAYAEIDRRVEKKMEASVKVIDKDWNVLLDLTTPPV